LPPASGDSSVKQDCSDPTPLDLISWQQVPSQQRFLGGMFALFFLFLLQRASADVHKLQITCPFVLPCAQDTHSKIQSFRLQSTNPVTVKYLRTLSRPNRRKLQSQTKVILPNQRPLLMCFHNCE
jgi:hypothetical protein